MPQARLRRGTTARTTAELTASHPVDGDVSRTTTAHIVADLDIGDPGA
jgi:hypothetical protein